MSIISIKDEILEKINKFVSENKFLSFEIGDDADKYRFLKDFLGNGFDKKTTFNNFNVFYSFVGIKVIFYNTFDLEKVKSIDHVLIVDEKNPIFRMEYFNDISGKTENDFERYFIYEDRTNQLSDILSVSTLKNDGFCEKKYTIYSNINCDNSKYSILKCNLFYNNDTLYAFEQHNEMRLINSSDNMRFKVINTTIDNMETTILNKLDTCLGIDEVKSYIIKKKKSDKIVVKND